MFDDWRLVARFNQGDRDAFQRIYLKYRSELIKVAGCLLFDQAAAEDVLHDVFVSFARQAGSFRLRGKLKAYLAICVANKARDINRRAAHRNTVELNESHLSVPSTGPDHRFLAQEQNQHLAAALAGLPFDQREVVVLHLQQGLRFRDIASQKALSINTVMSRYRYALEKLRSHLDGEL